MRYASREMRPPYEEANSASMRWRVVLVGDAGWVAEGAPLLQAIRKAVEEAAGRATVLYLGDNAYAEGLPKEPSPDRAAVEAVLSREIEAALDAGGECVFLPGNHDWGKGDSGALLRQMEFVAERGGRFLPAGAAGPDTLERPGVRIVGLDTERLIAERAADRNQEGTWRRLEQVLQHSDDRTTLLVAHHPPKSYGPHGGRFGWRERVPLVGMLAENVVSWGIRLLAGRDGEEIGSGAYGEVMEELRKVVKSDPPLLYAAGHDHNLQVLQGGDYAGYVAISGAGSKLSPVGWGDDALFCASVPGLMVLDIYRNAPPRLHVWRTAGTTEEIYDRDLVPPEDAAADSLSN